MSHYAYNRESYLFGLHRSGTNYLASLLNINFSGLKLLNTSTNFSEHWKHLIKVPEKMADAPIFVIYKNHLTWLESVIFRKPWDGKHIIMSTTIQDNIINYERIIKTKNDFILSNEKISLNFIANCYRQFYENWILNLSLDVSKNLIVIKYEDLLDCDQRNTILNKISNILHWNDREELADNINWLNPEKGKVFLSEKYNSESERYYIEGVPQFLSSEQIAVANEIIDKDFVKQLNDRRLK